MSIVTISLSVSLDCWDYQYAVPAITKKCRYLPSVSWYRQRGFAWSDMVHGCMVYTERAEMAAVSCGTSHASAVTTPLRWIFKNAL